jgi:hypothetical protein
MGGPTMRPTVHPWRQAKRTFSLLIITSALACITNSLNSHPRADRQLPLLATASSVPFTASAVLWHRNTQTTGKLLSNFSNPAGLIFVPQIRKCLITGHYLIETEFNLHRWNLKIGQVISQLKTYIQNPFIDSAIDMVNYRFKRSSESPKSPRTPKTTKTQAFTFSSLQKFIVYLENYAVPFIFNGFLTLFQNSKSTFRPFPFSPYIIERTKYQTTTLPFVDHATKRAFIEISDPLDENVYNLYYSTLTKLNEQGNELTLDGTTITYNVSANPFNDQLLQLEHTVDILHELLQDATASLIDLQRHYLPIHGHDYDDLSRIVDDILKTQNSPLFTVKQMLNYLRTHHHTFVVRDDCTSSVPTNACSMYIVTYLPIVNTQNCYRQFELQSFPVVKPGIIKDDWIQVKLKEQYLLINEFAVKIIDPKNYNCLENEDNIFELCVTRNKRVTPPSLCFERILQAKTLPEITKYCDYIKLNYVSDQATFLDSDSVAYVNPNPGTIITRCPDDEIQTNQLQQYGIINMDQRCSYEMVNGPLAPEDSYYPFLTVTSLAEQSSVILHNPESQEILTYHLQEYAIYYVSGLASAIALLISFFIVYCSYGKYIPCCNICVRRMGQNHRHSRPNVPPRPSAPILPNSPPIDQPYRDVRNHLQRLVRDHLATTAI